MAESINQFVKEGLIKYMSKSRVTWNRKQCTIYQRLSTWITYYFSHGFQILRVDLTSVKTENPDYKKLTKDFKKLVKRINKNFDYNVHYFYVQTREGYGVMHTCLAIESKTAAYVPFDWIKENWKEIHNGAWGVYVKRVSTEDHKVNAAKYMVSQYLGGQVMINRYDWSRNGIPFSLPKTWVSFKKVISSHMPDLWTERMYGRDVVIKEKLPKKLLYKLWNALIQAGQFQIGDDVYALIDGSLEPVYEVTKTFSSDQIDEAYSEVPF